MESSMTAIKKIDLIQSAIQQLVDSRIPHNNNNNNSSTDHDPNLLPKLLSQLESLKRDIQNPSKTPFESNELPSNTDHSESETINKDEPGTSSRKTGHEEEDGEEEEVVKALKKLGRQNKITHWLLSGLMILTVAWQLSEVSILLKLKDGVRHPFRTLGNVVSGVFKAPISDALKSEIPSSSSTKKNGSNRPLNPGIIRVDD